ncbi:MAG TPA: protein kinase, partial [Bryobacteraceae bacterium]
DFGLAQVTEPEYRDDSEETRTLTGAAEQVVSGTAGYMSPEQAEGKKLDARSDIFSFGAVLYEMVTGRRAFRGHSTASTLAAVLRQDPEPPTSITPQVPRELERIIQRCLRKDPSRRFHSMNDVKVELEEVRQESEPGMHPAVQASTRRRRRAGIYAAAFGAVLVITATAWLSLHQPLPPAASEPIPLTSYEGDELWPDFSPDGNQVTFAWDGGPDGKFHLYVKLFSAPNHLQLTSGDGNEMFPAWSPDGRWIAFQRWDRTGSHTMLISPLGGPERKVRDGVCDAQLPSVLLPQIAPFHLSWSGDGKWLVCSSPDGSIVALSVFGDETRHLTSPPVGHRDVFPAFSPHNNDLLFERTGLPVFFGCDLFLLDLKADLSPRGQPRRITHEHALFGGFAWTADGRDAIWSHFGSLRPDRVSVFRSGPIERLPFEYANYPAVSRQQRRLTYGHWAENSDIWRTDGQKSERDAVSSTAGDAFSHFSPDGKRIAFVSYRSGPLEVWVANADGTQPVPLTSFGGFTEFPRWSPDGRSIALTAAAPDGSLDIWIVDANGGTPHRMTQGPGNSSEPSFSHDGKWLYFMNTRNNGPEIFRMPIAGGHAEQITHPGAFFPLESPDGKMVYYVKSGELFRVPVNGGQERPLGLHVIRDDFAIMPDGIYYIAQMHGNQFRGGELRFYDFATRRERVIQPLGDVLFLFGFSVSPDRKTFLYSAEQSTASTLLLVENFR